MSRTQSQRHESKRSSRANKHNAINDAIKDELTRLTTQYNDTGDVAKFPWDESDLTIDQACELIPRSYRLYDELYCSRIKPIGQGSQYNLIKSYLTNRDEYQVYYIDDNKSGNHNDIGAYLLIYGTFFPLNYSYTSFDGDGKLYLVVVIYDWRINPQEILKKEILYSKLAKESVSPSEDYTKLAPVARSKFVKHFKLDRRDLKVLLNWAADRFVDLQHAIEVQALLKNRNDVVDTKIPITTFNDLTSNKDLVKEFNEILKSQATTIQEWAATRPQFKEYETKTSEPRILSSSLRQSL